MNLSQKIYESKIEKHKIESLNFDIFNYISTKREEFQLEKDKLESEKTKIVSNFNSKMGIRPNNPGTYYTGRRQTSFMATHSPDFYMQHSDLNRTLSKYDKKIEQLTENFNKTKEKFEFKILQNKQKIEKNVKEMKVFKNVLNNLIKEQRIYFTNILKSGIDVRHEGLTWVVKRLIELNSHLEYSMFPRYLDHNQIDYLIKFSYKQIELTQMKIILNTFKNRQRILREKQSFELFNKANKQALLKTQGSRYFFFNFNDSLSSFNKTGFSNKTMNIFDNIFKKYDDIMKVTFEKKIEDIEVN